MYYHEAEAFVYRFKRLSLFIYLAMAGYLWIVVYQLAMNIDIGTVLRLQLAGDFTRWV